jgi:uncharacterized protein
VLRAVTRRLKVAPCPRCGQRASLETTNAWRPFCSERCKMIDLGKWASEEYAIAAEEPGLQTDEGPPDETHQ